MQQFELPRRVDQAILHEVGGARPGDCLRAAMATITDRALLEVPHFVEYPPGDWWAMVEGYVERVTAGRAKVLCYSMPDNTTQKLADWARESGWQPETEYGVILTGPSPRGAFGHAVVGDPRTLTMVHDPHPSRAGILELEEVYVLVPA